MYNHDHLEKISRLIRHHILTSTTEAGSGHLTSSLSAVELMVTLMFSGLFRYDVSNPAHPNNDRLIFSKGHAAPLLYALWAVAGGIPQEELQTLRKFGSRLEGHPTMNFPFAEVATGSLGQGLSIGEGMALNAQYLDKLPYRTFVLLGDSEMAEGSNWEAIQLSAHYKLHSLVGIIDVNRLGQRGETMYGHDLDAYKNRIHAFGWNTSVVDGHNIHEIHEALSKACDNSSNMPTMIIAKTFKGKGVSIVENKEGWHGKTLTKEECDRALQELGDIDINMQADMTEPEDLLPTAPHASIPDEIDTDYNRPIATRKAYGHALVELYPKYPDMVVLDAEVSNSTYAETFKYKYPGRFFEMFIAEQNMVGAAVGLAARGKIPFVSTFASFFTRAFDHIRIAQYSQSHINFVGSHVGISIGEDGPSQMGLEDIALFRSILGSVVLYPADHVSDEKLVEQMILHPSISYMRTMRIDTEPIYDENEEFVIGGSKVLKSSDQDHVTVIAAGITLYEALKAYKILQEQGVNIRVVDLYSIKPLDQETLHKAAKETKALIIVEDHFAEGGIGEAVMAALADQPTSIHSLAVRKIPRSGKPHELLDYAEISSPYIIEKVMSIAGS